ncbi:carbohydrate kinase family protein [Candidatus Nitrososphaera sp. FF02]|uniref:carbohydrate kinase family protein n=1 Tax=Candidatus Nitrososphaera sp. FF02 TaxID=3398226 RepID=UPI0039EA55CF
MKVDCLCIGDIFFDFSIPLDDTRFRMIRGGTVNVRNLAFSPGGVGNIATMISHLGSKSAFCGVIGDDALGYLYKKDLENNHVLPLLFTDRRRPTGQLLSLISDDERSFIACRGANDSLESNRVSTVIRRTSPTLVIVSGHSLSSRSMERILLNAIRFARKSGIKVMFDCTPYNTIQLKRSIYRRVINNVDCLCLNIVEAKALTGKDNIREIIESLSDIVDILALKMGKSGCIIATRKEIVRVNAPKVKVIDTTGAGDAFAAAIAYGIINNLPLSRMAKIAVRLSTEKVRNLGPRFYPPKSWIRDLLHQ